MESRPIYGNREYPIWEGSGGGGHDFGGFGGGVIYIECAGII